MNQDPNYAQQGGTPPPPNYGQQPYGQQPGYAPPPMAPAPNRWGPTSLGMEATVAAGLSYLSMFVLGPIIPIVFFFVEKTNRFLKFHAAQGILLNIVGAVLGVLWFVVSVIFSAGSVAASNSNAASAGLGLGVCLTACILGLAGLSLTVGAIWGTIAGFTGQYTKFPVIGDIAERWAGGPATPLY